jgi:hypothetical protein
MTLMAGPTTSGKPSTVVVNDHEPDGTSAKEYTPSLFEIVERIPPPARTAVTVAPATGCFAASATMPTIVP